jgi:hypothetical protein
VQRIELVELIEGETAKLSPRGRELFETVELWAEGAPEEGAAATMPPPSLEMVAVIRRISEELPLEEQAIIDRTMELSAGLRRSDFEERRGKPGEPQRDRAVISAAGIKDRKAGRQIDPYMTPERAAARLREPG